MVREIKIFLWVLLYSIIRTLHLIEGFIIWLLLPIEIIKEIIENIFYVWKEMREEYEKRSYTKFFTETNIKNFVFSELKNLMALRDIKNILTIFKEGG